MEDRMRRITSITLLLIFMAWIVQPVQATLPKKGTARTVTFAMKDTNGDFTTGLTITTSVSKDGGAFAASSNSVTEVGNGLYKLTLTATEMNADTVAVLCSATGASTLLFSMEIGDYTRADLEALVDGVESGIAALPSTDLTATVNLIYADTNELQTNQNWDVWDDVTRTLTALDEDSTSIDLDGTTVGDVTNAVSTDLTTTINAMIALIGSSSDSSSMSGSLFAGQQAIYDASAGSGAGTGVNTVVLDILNTSGGAGLEGVNIYIYNSANTSLLYSGRTNASGRKTFLLDDATYKVRSYLPSYQADNIPETLTVSGDTTDTYYMSASATAGDASDISICRVYIQLFDSTGTYYTGQCKVKSIFKGYVTAALGDGHIPVGGGSGVVINTSETKTTNATTGAVYFDCVRGGSYKFSFDPPYDKFSDTKTIPNSATANYGDM